MSMDTETPRYSIKKTLMSYAIVLEGDSYSLLDAVSVQYGNSGKRSHDEAFRKAEGRRARREQHRDGQSVEASSVWSWLRSLRCWPVPGNAAITSTVAGPSITLPCCASSR